eukprot:Blabericola_migrator_1__6382@NODE_3216_length_1942_cov_14_068800_g2013_i0_p2_GENE_NODE_3216_length_1942_cov_14_068800_g2013_i0NODE_3216_length_1942_cov_14_068800_g2013_i0_p2_ORF_typecomplete_len170_score31_54FAM24/PF15193_6/0_24DUF1995/PF09353_10/0_12_NODE_3216_length_1942_cov_14_068800_g2013_i010781587
MSGHVAKVVRGKAIKCDKENQIKADKMALESETLSFAYCSANPACRALQFNEKGKVYELCTDWTSNLTSDASSELQVKTTDISKHFPKWVKEVKWNTKSQACLKSHIVNQFRTPDLQKGLEELTTKMGSEATFVLINPDTDENDDLQWKIEACSEALVPSAADGYFVLQ